MNSRCKSQPGYNRSEFTLTHSDFSIIRKCGKEKRLGEKDYCAALGLILREWKGWKDQQHHPFLIAVLEDNQAGEKASKRNDR